MVRGAQQDCEYPQCREEAAFSYRILSGAVVLPIDQLSLPQDTGSIGNYGLIGSLSKHAEHKFRAIADGSTAEIGETDRWVK